MSDKIALTDLPRILRERHDVAVTYYQLWTAATNGRIPALKVSGRWSVWQDQIPAIAAEMARRTRSAA